MCSLITAEMPFLTAITASFLRRGISYPMKEAVTEPVLSASFTLAFRIVFPVPSGKSSTSTERILAQMLKPLTPGLICPIQVTYKLFYRLGRLALVFMSLSTNKVYSINMKSGFTKSLSSHVTVAPSRQGYRPSLHVRSVSQQDVLNIEQDFKTLLRKKKHSRDQFRNNLLVCDSNTSSWLKKHHKANITFSYQELRQMKKLFRLLDKDGSGSISAQELFMPFLTMGLVSSKQQVKKLVDRVDQNHNGQIQFFEFAKVFKYSKNQEGHQLASFFKNIIKNSQTLKASYSFPLFLGKKRREDFMNAIRQNDSLLFKSTMKKIQMYKTFGDLKLKKSTLLRKTYISK